MKYTLSLLAALFVGIAFHVSTPAFADEAGLTTGAEAFATVLESDQDMTGADDAYVSMNDHHHCVRRCEREYSYCTSGCPHGHHGHECRRHCEHRYNRCVHHCHHH